MAYDLSEQRVADALRLEISKELSRIGLLFRVFARSKSKESIANKLKVKGYGSSENPKKMQDLFGVRVALYFPDDSDLAQRAVKKHFEWDEKSSTVDEPSDATFGPSRCNLIFRLPSNFISQCPVLETESAIDSTFEVQFRTVFSEGWHEVEHDLRYKCRSDWTQHPDLNRAMNGLIATLETCDWAIVKVFDELAFRHYRAQEWLAMVRSKFRLRWQLNALDDAILEAFENDHGLAKSIYRVNRERLLTRMFEEKIEVPINPSNLIYIANAYFIHSEALRRITPEPIIEELAQQGAFRATL